MTAAPLAHYRAMLRIRRIETAIAGAYPEGEMRCPVHLSVGQEAAAVGVCAALRASDQIVSTHRCHAHYLAKGGDLRAMMAEIFGKVTGCCGGRGGSMNLFDRAAGVLVSLPIVASAIPLGVGAALAFRQQARSEVVVVFTGDGAVEEGVFHESLNYAALARLPVVFVVENNQYSVYTPLAQRQPARPLADLAGAHGLPAVTVDGNDVGAVAEAAASAVARAREGAGPGVLVLDTWRWLEHCGPFEDDHLGYRCTETSASWRDRCPVVRVAEALRAAGRLDADTEARLTAQIDAEIAEAFAFARSSPFPRPIGEDAHD